MGKWLFKVWQNNECVADRSNHSLFRTLVDHHCRVQGDVEVVMDSASLPANLDDASEEDCPMPCPARSASGPSPYVPLPQQYYKFQYHGRQNMLRKPAPLYFVNTTIPV